MPDVLALPVLAGFSEVLAQIVTLLCWAAWVVLNLWLFQKTKATANLLMMLASAYITLEVLFGIFGGALGGPWMLVLAMVVLTGGFFLSVRVQVEAQLAKVREKIQGMASGRKDAGAPPAPPPAPTAPPSS